jgi:class 3 adenylate cyclase
MAAHAFEMTTTSLAGPVQSTLVATRIRNEQGRLCGTALIGQPAMPVSLVGVMMGALDVEYLDRMMTMLAAGRRPAAILMADIERSSLLSKRLSTAHYFALARRMVRATDQCVIDAGGLLGRHVGDGVTAFFPAEISGSESAAAHACIGAARAMRAALGRIAERSELDPEALVVRFGLHWGSSLYVGNIASKGRFEVTGMGDDVNDAARIEASASGGRMLVSKHLVERLDTQHAADLGIDPDNTRYTQLADLDTATDKVRRDAPAIAVCDL